MEEGGAELWSNFSCECDELKKLILSLLRVFSSFLNNGLCVTLTHVKLVLQHFQKYCAVCYFTRRPLRDANESGRFCLLLVLLFFTSRGQQIGELLL